MEFSPGHSVEGCVYAITDTELKMLDNCMGYPKVSQRAREIPAKYFILLIKCDSDES